jgi:hypothetical protein
MLSFTVLLGCVWAQEANMYAMCGGEGVEFGIVKLMTVVTLMDARGKLNCV